MNATQPQLIQSNLNSSDMVFTSDWVARDMVEWFKPSGTILEPSSGDGVFLKYLPSNTLWCEIEKGRDFFAHQTSVDWIVGNPPYSQYVDFMMHSMRLANNILYVVPINKPFNSSNLYESLMSWGCIAHIRYYGKSRSVFRDVDIGFGVGAVHFSKSATCTTYSSYNDLA